MQFKVLKKIGAAQRCHIFFFLFFGGAVFTHFNQKWQNVKHSMRNDFVFSPNDLHESIWHRLSIWQMCVNQCITAPARRIKQQICFFFFVWIHWIRLFLNATIFRLLIITIYNSVSLAFLARAICSLWIFFFLSSHLVLYRVPFMTPATGHLVFFFCGFSQ